MVEAADLFVLGGGGHARVVGEAATSAGRSIVGHFSLEPSASDQLGSFLGPDLSEFPTRNAVLAIGIGFVDSHSRSRRVGAIEQVVQLGIPVATVVHPTALVAGDAVLGAGVFVAAGAIVASGCEIGAYSVVNTGAVVDHDCRVGSDCHVATGARLAGAVTLGPRTLVGVGASIIQGRDLGAEVIIGAGAAVVQDVVEGLTVVGVPARPKQ